MASVASGHTVKCPFCGFQIRTTDTSPTLYCWKCNRQFPNPHAVAEPGDMSG